MANNMETTAEIIESIRELIERIEMSPRTPVALTDIAPESAWDDYVNSKWPRVSA